MRRSKDECLTAGVRDLSSEAFTTGCVSQNKWVLLAVLSEMRTPAPAARQRPHGSCGRPGLFAASRAAIIRHMNAIYCVNTKATTPSTTRPLYL